MTFQQVRDSVDFHYFNLPEEYKKLLPGYSIVKVENSRGKQIEIYCNNPNCELHKSKITVPAYTVDDDIYTNHPSFIISTVDKIARLAFDPSASDIFKNTNSYSGPNLIIQDELHLLTGSMGSLFGVYENSVSAILNQENPDFSDIKYIAASATVNRYKDQIAKLFASKGILFPPGGLSSSDSFFFHDVAQGINHIIPEKSGRVYMGIMAAGTSMQSALIDIITNIIKMKYQNKNLSDIKYFWTPVLYFNSIKELSIAGSFYREDSSSIFSGSIFVDLSKFILCITSSR